MKNKAQNESRIEKGTRMAFEFVLQAKIENIYDSKEIENAKQANITILLKKYLKEFEKVTGLTPSSISMSSDLLYLCRQQIQKETGEYQNSETAKFEGVRIKSGCSIGETETVISAWKNENEIIVA